MVLIVTCDGPFDVVGQSSKAKNRFDPFEGRAQNEYAYGVEQTESNLMMPMRDGVSLATDIYRPTRITDAELPVD